MNNERRTALHAALFESGDHDRDMEGHQLLLKQSAIAALEIGRHLQTVEHQVRPALLKQISNSGERLASFATTAEAGRVILLMCAAWRGEVPAPNWARDSDVVDFDSWLASIAESRK